MQIELKRKQNRKRNGIQSISKLFFTITNKITTTPKIAIAPITTPLKTFPINPFPRISLSRNLDPLLETKIFHNYPKFHVLEIGWTFTKNGHPQNSTSLSVTLDNFTIAFFHFPWPSPEAWDSVIWWIWPPWADLQNHAALWVSRDPRIWASYSCCLLHGRTGITLVSMDG